MDDFPENMRGEDDEVARVVYATAKRMKVEKKESIWRPWLASL